MKKVIYIFLNSLFAISVVNAQNTADNKKNIAGAHISFSNTAHDFGIIQYLGNGSYIYVFTNTGTEPLVVTNCIKGCGCTSVTWTKDPVNPGEKGMVKATYDTRKVGDFNRGVDVYSNDLENPKINLRLKGTVEKIPIDSLSDTHN